MIEKNMLEEDYTFTTVNDEGLTVECDVIAVLKEKEDTYIIYTDYTLDENDDFKVYVSKLEESNGEYTLVRITDLNTIPFIKAALKEAKDKINLND